MSRVVETDEVRRRGTVLSPSPGRGSPSVAGRFDSDVSQVGELSAGNAVVVKEFLSAD